MGDELIMMKRKISISILYVSFVLVLGVAVYLTENKGNLLAATIIAAVLGVVIEKTIWRIQDVFDNKDWKTSFRQLKRGKIINDDTLVRVSFAYLYRIKVDDKYLLVKNSRNTGKYQPVGGVYKMEDEEKLFLKNRFHVIDDDDIPVDYSSQNDYRLCMKSKYLKAFVRRFNSSKSKRERVDELGREFREELVDSRLIDWSQINYRYCGRHITDLKFGDHFQKYELLLADIVELMPTENQLIQLKAMMKNQSKEYCFATSKQIDCLGIDTEHGQLNEWIAIILRRFFKKTKLICPLHNMLAIFILLIC